MKKFISITTASMLALTLVACGGGEEQPAENTGDNTTTDQSTTDNTADDTTDSDVVDSTDIEGDLYIWLDNEDWTNALIEGFNEVYPNINVEFETVGSVDQRQKLELDGPSGIGPDVFILPHDHMGVAISDGLAQPIEGDMAMDLTDRMLEPSLGTVTVDGMIYGAPISTENIALFYNKDIYGEEAPETMEEIIEFAKSYNDPANNQYAFRWDIDDAYHNYFFLSAFGHEIFGENHDDYKAFGLDTPEAIAGVEYHNSLKEIFDVATGDATYEETVGKFQNGEAVFTVTGPWSIADAKNNGVNFGVAKLPTIEGKQPIAFSGNIIAGVSAYSENKDLAMLFVDFMASEEGAAITFDVTGKMPAFKDVTNVPGISEDPYLNGVAAQSPYTIPMPTIAEMSLAWGPLEEIFKFSWDGDLTPEEAATKAMETYEISLNGVGKSIND